MVWQTTKHNQSCTRFSWHSSQCNRLNQYAHLCACCHIKQLTFVIPLISEHLRTCSSDAGWNKEQTSRDEGWVAVPYALAKWECLTNEHPFENLLGLWDTVAVVIFLTCSVLRLCSKVSIAQAVCTAALRIPGNWWSIPLFTSNSFPFHTVDTFAGLMSWCLGSPFTSGRLRRLNTVHTMSFVSFEQNKSEIAICQTLSHENV